MPFGVFRAGGRGGRFIRHSTDCDEHCNLIQWMCVCVRVWKPIQFNPKYLTIYRVFQCLAPQWTSIFYETKKQGQCFEGFSDPVWVRQGALPRSCNGGPLKVIGGDPDPYKSIPLGQICLKLGHLVCMGNELPIILAVHSKRNIQCTRVIDPMHVYIQKANHKKARTEQTKHRINYGYMNSSSMKMKENLCT